MAPPVEPLLTEMSPADALAAELYHWLKYAGDRTDTKAVALMLNQTLRTIPPKFDNNHSDDHSFGMQDNEINSCLVNDTGARLHALMFDSKEGGAGQAALARAFQINGSYRASSQVGLERQSIPENALPLFVDPRGQCLVGGKSPFDTQVIRDFFQDLYATNLAARETIATLKPLQQANQQIIPQLEQKLMVEKEELSSLVRRRQSSPAHNDAKNTPDNALSVQQRIMIDRIEDLKLIVESDSTQIQHLRNMLRLATNARHNAGRAELNTFELNAQKARYCREGIFKIPGGGYLLGKKLAFRPMPRALLESDFNDSVTAAASNISDYDQSIDAPSVPASEAESEYSKASKRQLSPWISNSLVLIGLPREVYPILEKSNPEDGRVSTSKAPATTVSNR